MALRTPGHRLPVGRWLLARLSRLPALADRDEGATAVEYAIMMAAIAAVVVVAVAVLGSRASAEFECVNQQLETDGTATC